MRVLSPARPLPAKNEKMGEATSLPLVALLILGGSVTACIDVSHAAIRNSSSNDQSRSVTPAAIAGVIRISPGRQQKL